MRWLVDECVAASLVHRLPGAGHDALSVRDTVPGITDTEVLRLAHDEGRLPLTEDKDFGELVFWTRMPVPGVVLLRIDPRQVEARWTRLAAAIAQFSDAFLGRYVVVEEKRSRSRPLLRSLLHHPRLAEVGAVDHAAVAESDALEL